MSPEERCAKVAADALAEAWAVGVAAHWLRRAKQLEAARPRPSDYPGKNATAADTAARSQRLTEAAAACRARATGADGWAGAALVETAYDVAGEDAA